MSDNKVGLLTQGGNVFIGMRVGAAVTTMFAAINAVLIVTQHFNAAACDHHDDMQNVVISATSCAGAACLWGLIGIFMYWRAGVANDEEATGAGKIRMWGYVAFEVLSVAGFILLLVYHGRLMHQSAVTCLKSGDASSFLLNVHFQGMMTSAAYAFYAGSMAAALGAKRYNMIAVVSALLLTGLAWVAAMMAIIAHFDMKEELETDENSSFWSIHAVQVFAVFTGICFMLAGVLFHANKFKDSQTWMTMFEIVSPKTAKVVFIAGVVISTMVYGTFLDVEGNEQTSHSATSPPTIEFYEDLSTMVLAAAGFIAVAPAALGVGIAGKSFDFSSLSSNDA